MQPNNRNNDKMVFIQNTQEDVIRKLTNISCMVLPTLETVLNLRSKFAAPSTP